VGAPQKKLGSGVRGKKKVIKRLSPEVEKLG
jgi:hypothetical protein